MNADCLDIGIVQAFLDGELAQADMSRVSGHVALCDACAVMLAEAEDESAIVFPALEREFNTLVPTQRLWNRINESIAVERDNLSFGNKIWAFLTACMVNPSIAVAASVLIIAGVTAVIWMNRSPVNDTVASTTSPVKISIPIAAPATRDNLADIAPPTPARIERAVYRADNHVKVTPAVYTTPKAVNITSDGYLPGEESYVKTISGLSKSVDEQKDSVMRPSERIAYERDMAVVNDAIAKMKTAVRKNPGNESARQVLYSSYQNKIDLLNSVSQKEELMASLK